MRKALQEIIFLGRLTRNVKILGKTWTLQTIDIDEHMKAVKQINLNDDNNNFTLLLLKRKLLERAIVSVEGIEIKDDEREEFVSQLPITVINLLFDEYNKLNEEFKIENEDEKKLVEEIKN